MRPVVYDRGIEQEMEMTLGSKEHEDMIRMFERIFPHEGRLDKEAKEFWARGNVYQHGEVNKLFLAFRHGVAYGEAVSR